VGGHLVSVADIATGRFWQIVVLTMAGALGAPSRAEAALYYWPDSDPSYYRPSPPAQPSRQRSRRHSAKKDKKEEASEKQTGAKPQGPLIISVSISKQHVKIYDANGFFAEAPISTGMRGHATPMGVFSVIQKQKWHRSNIYSGAPMPYMQRITWSGIAMHAGVLPGYPASHGCIRMPTAFAIKMWSWTKMGARVLVTPGEMTPESFSHPLLPAFKVAAQPATAEVPHTDAAPTVKADKGAPVTKPVAANENLELRPTVGHNTTVEPATGKAAAPLREQTHTADAGGVPANQSTMSDALSTTGAPTAKEAVAGDAAKVAASGAADMTQSVGDDARARESVAPSAKAEAASLEAKAEMAPLDAKVETKPDAAKPVQAQADAPKATPEAAKPDEKPADGVKGASESPTSPIDVKKDPSRLLDADKPATAKAEPPRRAGQIAVFISRKDSKLYVRQNFEPLFDVPVTIAASDRPLGTHVFTAETDKNDANALHWSVVSLPVTTRALVRDDDDHISRHRKMAGAGIEAKPAPVPDSPAEALDRITIPPDTMVRIAEAMTTGGSIIVSDQGINQGDTGEGTDFIVSLR
jgi:lipoprotein-anchoring transpeptidase ErfK/SrfK